LAAGRIAKSRLASWTANTGTASAKPRNGRVPSSAKRNAVSTSVATVPSIRICPSPAAAQIRDAKFTTLPIAM
jgi:hypothetical protein